MVGKHYESLFTRFFQGCYLPEKFGFDKRRAHLSSLVLSDQLSREQALEEMRKPPYPEGKLDEDRLFFLKKLGLTERRVERHSQGTDSNLQRLPIQPVAL